MTSGINRVKFMNKTKSSLIHKHQTNSIKHLLIFVVLAQGLLVTVAITCIYHFDVFFFLPFCEASSLLATLLSGLPTLTCINELYHQLHGLHDYHCPRS